ncbi:unnamed protein product, partial [Rotaria sp. Silwood1]
LEMNFADPSDRVVMGRYARTEALSEPDSEEDDHVDESLSSSLKLNESSESSSDITEDEDVCPVSHTNVQVFETFGMHSKFFDEQNLHPRLPHLKNILCNREFNLSDRPVVSVGETGLDETSPFHIIHQKIAFTEQVLLARDTGLPLILHCRGYSFIVSCSIV